MSPSSLPIMVRVPPTPTGWPRLPEDPRAGRVGFPQMTLTRMVFRTGWNISSTATPFKNKMAPCPPNLRSTVSAAHVTPLNCPSPHRRAPNVSLNAVAKSPRERGRSSPRKTEPRRGLVPPQSLRSPSRLASPGSWCEICRPSLYGTDVFTGCGSFYRISSRIGNSAEPPGRFLEKGVLPFAQTVLGWLSSFFPSQNIHGL